MSEKMEPVDYKKKYEELRQKLEKEKSLLDETERKFNYLKIYYDVTVTTSPDAIVLVNASNQKIMEVNRSFENLLGYSADEVVGKTTADFNFWIHSDKRDKYYARVIKEQKVDNYEAEFKTKNGEVKFGIISAKIIDIDGAKYIFSMTRDVTLAKKSERDLKIAKDKAEKSDKLKSEFLAQMSHEIRTPVNTILSFSSLLENELSEMIPENVRFGFKMIDNGGRRLIRTIELILNVSELHTGTYIAHKKFIDLLSEILHPMIHELQNLAYEKGITLNFNYSEEDDYTVFADQYTITQLFLNLIDNAIKYTHEGSITVDIRRNEGNKLYSVIEDTGIGMSEKFINTIYVPFTQEESGYSRKYEGTGLGLALVKKCCEINNVEIDVKSEKGKGTTFFLKFV